MIDGRTGLMLALVLLQLVASPQPAATAQPPADCGATPRRQFAHKSDLPKGVAEAFGAPMADKGQPFQASDVVVDPALPINRFIGAEQQGCALRLDYERGGRGHSFLSATLFQDGGSWRLIGQKYDRDPQRE